MACKCLTQLIEPLKRQHDRTAFLTEPAVTMSRGFRSCHTISTMRAPDGTHVVHHLLAERRDRCRAGQRHAERLGRRVHGVGRAHAGTYAGALHGHVGHVRKVLERDRGRRRRSPTSRTPLRCRRAGRETPRSLDNRRSTTIDGMSSRPAAMICPGVVLSHEARHTMPSSSAPSTWTSMSAAMRSRARQNVSAALTRRW